MKYDDMSFIDKQPEMCDVIGNIAIINANKFPSITGSYTLHANLVDEFEKSKKKH
jgi:hypothetical protein